MIPFDQNQFPCFYEVPCLCCDSEMQMAGAMLYKVNKAKELKFVSGQ